MLNSFPHASSAETRDKVYRRPLSKRVELGIGAFLFVSVSIICIFALLFLSHSNRVATKGYDLRVLQSHRSELLQENEILSMQIADLQALSALENDAVIRAMVKAEKPQYIRGDTAVASIPKSEGIW